jgi:hypothetical protein
MTAYLDNKAWPSGAGIVALDGPGRSYEPPANSARPSAFQWTAFESAVRDTSAYCRTFHRLPDEVWIGVDSISPADYLATLARTLEHLAAGGSPPGEVGRVEGHFTADRFVADDSPQLWSWPIFPDGFHAPRIMQLARLQAWTLKPAVMRGTP